MVCWYAIYLGVIPGTKDTVHTTALLQSSIGVCKHDDMCVSWYGMVWHMAWHGMVYVYVEAGLTLHYESAWHFDLALEYIPGCQAIDVRLHSSPVQLYNNRPASLPLK